MSLSTGYLALAQVEILGILALSLLSSSSAETKKEVGEAPMLVEALLDIAQGDVGYSPTVSGSRFLPIDEEFTVNGGLFGAKSPVLSETMRQLVRQGMRSFPILVRHLNDQRPTKLSVKHDFAFGGMYFLDEYDYNRRTTESPAGVNKVRNDRINSSRQHTLTVGDLCFVAIGQIVNRNFNAIRYQPSFLIKINSPTHSAELRSAVIREWGNMTPEAHKASLVKDFLNPDNEERQIGAYKRLAYYYPEMTESLVLQQLKKRRYPDQKVGIFVHELYKENDSNNRRYLLGDFISKHGSASRDGILLQLFQDLDLFPAHLQLQVATEEKENPLNPATFKDPPRELLMEFYGFKQNVQREDRPFVDSVSNSEQAQFILAVRTDHNARIDKAVLDVFLSITDDDNLALACISRLLGRGFDRDIYNYCNRRAPLSTRDGDKLRRILELVEPKIQN